MRPVAIVLVVVAVLAAGLTAFLAKRWLDTQAMRRAQMEQAALTEVLVAARDLPAGTTLQADDLRWERWPEAAINPRLVTRSTGDDARGQYTGMVTRRVLAEGEPFTPAATFRADSAGVLAGLLAPGMRAVSIGVTSASAVSGFITPGDRVDVVLAADVRKTEGDSQDKGGPIVRFAAETVLEDVKVLAVDQQIARGRDGGAIQGKTATIEVTPKQAELLTAASMLGQLSLVLRGYQAAGEAKPAQPRDPFTPDVEASKALQSVHAPKARPTHQGGSGVIINRAGSVSAQSVAR
ncbi:MAG: Flp pilus assembly protein CpaB [Actinomycetota bacterium]